jgi:pilus assembly protein Flp/PilA
MKCFKGISLLVRGESGATAIEYAFVASLISIAAVSVIQFIGASVADSFSTVANSF